MTRLFKGVATAIVTPMNEDGTIDYENFERLVKFQLKSGIDALIVSGTTGEGSTLSLDEKLKLLEIAKECRGDTYDCPIVLGTGSNNTAESIRQTKSAKENGADAALLVTPYYNKTSQRGLIAHYFEIANNVDIPLILYNVPGRTGMTIEPKTVAKLSTHKNIIALKDATGNMKYMDKVRSLLDSKDEFALYSGDDGTFFDFLVHGGDGVISVISNCLPKMFKEIYNLYSNAEINKSRDLQIKLNPFISTLFSDVSPTPIKAVLAEMGYLKEYFRLPLISTTDTVRKNVIREYNLLKGEEDNL